MESKIIVGSFEDVEGFKNVTLLKNSARCKRCGDTVESKHNYDAVHCSCRFMMVDGGLISPRILGEEVDIEYLYEFLVDE